MRRCDGRADGRTVSRREALVASAGALAGLAVPASSVTAATDRPTARPPGRLRQSVSRWPYREIPLPDFCKAAAGMGLAAIDLLNPEEWDIVHDCGLVCSMGYPASRRDFIPTGFNDRANHATLLRELEQTIPLAAKHGVPNVITMFGNRRGKSDAEAIDNCVAGLTQIKSLAEEQRVTVCVEDDSRQRGLHRTLPHRRRARSPRAGRHTGAQLARDRCRHRRHRVRRIHGARVRADARPPHLVATGRGDLHRMIEPRAPSPQSRVYDVCIVGSGAGGGMAAHALTRAGADVIVLEAGVPWDNLKDSAMLTWPYESPRRGRSTKDHPFGEFDACIGGWEIEGEPYTRAAGTEFNWWRARMVGGRTNHWGRISLRFGPYDFKRKSRDGLGDDWPISYEDVAPYYDKIDRLIGVFGSKENLPNEPDGVFQPPPRPRCHELLVKQAADKLHITCIPSRLSILTRPLNGRAPCHYCGQCNRGCRVNANFTSTNVLIGPALTTGRLTLVTNAMAREVTVDKTGRASGVAYVDKTTGADRHVSAKVVVLAASALETARLLLNSQSSAFPNGLANGSGTVGKYITDTTGTDVGGFIPKMMDHVPHNHDGVGGMHLYMPWWLEDRKLDFSRGYHIEVWGGTHVPDYGVMGGIQRYPAGGGYGKQLKDDYRRYYGATIGFSGRGEMIPNDDTYCEIDPRTVDRWGIPVLRFHWKWSDHEYNQVKHMQETFRALIAEMGGEVFSPMPTRERGYGIAAGGVIIHELGGARMGDDPKTSVTNRWSQAHECKNLFVTDGAPFVSQADKNPTWTILALALRTSEHITELIKRGEL